jgi:predicted flap endonuclease-1-like 5' DNA nuclease
MMQGHEPINTPSLAGWAIAAGMAAVGAAVSYLVVGIGANGSVLIGGVLLVVVGLILGLPSSPVPAPVTEAAVAVTGAHGAGAHAPSAPAPAPVAAAAPVAAPVTAPIAAPVAAPVAPVMAAPAAAPMSAPPIAPPAEPVVTAAAPAVPAEKPRTLAAARDGRPDDLKLIKGIGPKMEAMLHRMGFFHFDQVAAWTPAELAWVDDNLEGFKGRASRDEWVAQAKILAAGGSTEFSSRPH